MSAGNELSPASAPNAGTGLTKQLRSDTRIFISKTTQRKQALFSAPGDLLDFELATWSDRRYFSRFRDRDHYVRPASRPEVLLINRLGLPPLDEGEAWFTLARWVGGKYRIGRKWAIAPAELMNHEPSEDQSREIWQSLDCPMWAVQRPCGGVV